MPPKSSEDIYNTLVNDGLLDTISISDAIAKDLLPEQLGDIIITCCDYDHRNEVDKIYLHRYETLISVKKESFTILCEYLMLTPEEAKAKEEALSKEEEDSFPLDHEPEDFSISDWNKVNNHAIATTSNRSAIAVSEESY